MVDFPGVAIKKFFQGGLHWRNFILLTPKLRDKIFLLR